MARALIALGSNLGERQELLRGAVRDLAAADAVVVEGVSPAVQSRPVGGPSGQPDYLNAVVRVRTDRPPHDLLALCQRIEADHGRERRERWGPRTLDLDLIDYDGRVLDDPVLTLPHPRAHERAFVLVPWSLLEPGAVLGDRPVRELARQAPDREGVSEVAG